MTTWRVRYSNGAVVLVGAYTRADAWRIAEEQAAADGRPGLSVVTVESLSEE